LLIDLLESVGSVKDENTGNLFWFCAFSWINSYIPPFGSL
jgi:hypothetical protein